jgi:outer membrane protein TolC
MIRTTTPHLATLAAGVFAAALVAPVEAPAQKKGGEASSSAKTGAKRSPVSKETPETSAPGAPTGGEQADGEQAPGAGQETDAASAPGSTQGSAEQGSAEQGDADRALTLDEALEMVAGRNEDWKILEAEIERSKAERRRALGGLLPSVRASASGTRLNSEIRAGDRVVRPRYGWDATATATFTLFDAPGYLSWRASSDMVEMARADADWQQRLLALETARAYFTLQGAQREVQIARQIVEARRADVERTRKLQRAGLAVPLDVARARTTRLEARQLLVESRAALEDASDALVALVAVEAGTQLRAADELDAPPTPPGADGGAPPRRSIVERADFASRDAEIASLDDRRFAELWRFAPTVSFNGQTNWGPPTFTNPTGFIWSLTLNLSWTLYDGGTRIASADALAQQIRQRRLARDNQVRRERLEIRRALREWRTAHRAHTLAAERVTLAERTYALVEKRLDAGLANSFDLTEASDTLLRARLEVNRTRLRARLAASQYRYLREIRR